MEHMFRKHVKPKKQHEINKLGRAIKVLSETCHCSQIIDVGAGLGHLSRLLTFQHGLKAITVEAADGHAPKAASFDKETKKDVHRFHRRRKKEPAAQASNESFNSEDKSKVCLSDISGSSKNETSENTSEEQFDDLPSHVICEVHPDVEASHFLDIVQLKADKGESEFILVGLHACGDLTPTLLRVFVDCPKAVALASVACCYMKISSDGSKTSANFPMSEFIQNLPCHELSYVSRELACHFIDAYYQRLKGNLPHLKIHSYRAALQCILKRIFPHIKNGDYRLVSKKGSQGTFTQYAVEIFKKVGIDTKLVPHELFQHCEQLTNYWKRVVAFYTLRLSLAPVVETFLLLDRALFLNEKGLSNVLIPIFDSSISPRNFALLAVKR
ncbi:Ribosomal RNA adenine dimethylase domain-containing protein 1 [Bulinus truncatus]|nr:Ribosomal RNA adenine dimethylase domain-containing protein 1 [Bulinus truncatus]